MNRVFMWDVLDAAGETAAASHAVYRTQYLRAEYKEQPRKTKSAYFAPCDTTLTAVGIGLD